MKKLIFCSLLFGLFSLVIIRSVNAQSGVYMHTPEIQAIVDEVKIDTMWNKLTYLQSQQRYTRNSNSQNTAIYLRNYMKTMGFDSVYFQTFTIPGASYVSPNIIGIKFGETNPDSIFIACGHWDVYASMAPGADDNGSGTVAVLEAARVLLKSNYKKTIKFCLFSGEEQGLYGSKKYVQVSAGDKIGAVLNMDMIAYQRPGYVLRMGLFPKNPATLGLYNKVVALQQLYVPGIEIGREVPCTYDCTDIYPFWNAGYDGLFLFETSAMGGPYETPYYHTSNDVINLSANSQPKQDKITKIVVASLATWAELYPVSVLETIGSLVSLSNYPNPVNNQTTIGFQLNSNAVVSLKITDITGKVITTLIDNEQKYSGLYEVPFDASMLESGMYLYVLITDNGNLTKKMMVIK
jgi:aminopeptidase YwaD